MKKLFFDERCYASRLNSQSSIAISNYRILIMIFLIIFNVQNALRWVILRYVTPEISLDMWKHVFVKIVGWKIEVEIVREVPEKLKNNVILPTRWFQISFSPIFLFFMSRASVWYITRRTYVESKFGPYLPSSATRWCLTKNNTETDFFGVDYV